MTANTISEKGEKLRIKNDQIQPQAQDFVLVEPGAK
jgi:hypothetical protein